MMRKYAWVLVPLFALPTAALAQSAGDRGPGAGTDLYTIQRQVDQMRRDGRWQQMIAEGQANRRAFESTREPAAPVTATGSVTPRRR